jgi:GDPmannose 4,6-dehydratase
LEFVTRKISHEVARIKQGLSNELRLGNLDARRDWGFAGDYVKAMWRMIESDQPVDYVIATGATHSVEQFLEVAFGCVDLDWHDYVVQDPRFVRPAEVDELVGDAAKAKNELDWEPDVSFEGLVNLMVDADMKLVRDGVTPM